MVDIALGNDPTLNSRGITAAAVPGAVVNLPGGSWLVDETIVNDGAAIVAGVGGTTLVVSRDALPSELGPQVYRPHIVNKGTYLCERIKVVGRNLLKQQVGDVPGIVASEFEHAFRADAGSNGKLHGCSADFVWGDGAYFGQGGIVNGLEVLDFTSEGVGRQVIAVAHHTGLGLIEAVRILASTRRGGIDIEPILGREVSGIEIRGCDTRFARLLPLTVGGHGNISDLNIHDNNFTGNEVRFQNDNPSTTQFKDFRFERNIINGGSGPNVRFSRIIRAVVLDNRTVRGGSNTGATPGIRITECPDILVQRNHSTGVAVCVGVNGDLTKTTGTIGAPVGDPNANTHTPAVGGLDLPEPILGWKVDVLASTNTGATAGGGRRMWGLAPIRERDDDGAVSYWHPHFALELRAYADRSQLGRTAGKFVLVSAPVLTPEPDLILIGETGFSVTPGRRASVQSVLGLGEALVGANTEDVVEELALHLADPMGIVRPPPIRVGSGMMLRIRLGDIRVDRRVQPADSEWQNTLAVERRNYATWRAQAVASAQALRDAGRTWEQVLEHKLDHALDPLDVNLLRLGAPYQHLKNLDHLEAHYGVSYREFLGSEPDEGTRPRGTTVTEDWNCADADSPNCDQTHTEVAGDLDIVSNELQNTLSETVVGRMEADVSSADHYAEVSSAVTVSGTPYVGVCARFAAAAQTHYAGTRRNNASNTWQLQSVEAGTGTNLTGSPASGAAQGSGYITDRVTCSGDQITYNSGGTDRIGPATSTTITTGTRAGIRGNPNGGGRAHWTSLEITDLAAGATVPEMMAARQMGTLQPAMIPTGVVAY